MSPLVSILVPVFNDEDTIERCARSVFEQTYDNLEYIYVDDDSPDSSMKILDRVLSDYPKRKEHTRIIRHPYNKGIAATRNTLVSNATGEFICYVDSDDWMESNAIRLLVDKQRETDADIVTGQALRHQAGDIQPYNSGDVNLDKETLLTQVLTYRVSTSLWRRLIRRSLYTDHGIKADERGSGGEDYQLLPQLLYYAHRVAGVDEIIYHYNRDNNSSIMNTLRHNLEAQKEGYVSVCVIADFFSNKEEMYQNIVRGLKIKHLHLRMMQNFSWRNRDGYDYFRKALLATNPEEWHYINWNHPIRKYIDTHYCMLIMIRELRKVKNLKKRIIKK